MTLMALKDPEFRIVDQPADQTTPSILPFAVRAEAEEVLKKATKQSPGIRWAIVGDGPWGIHGKKEN